MPFFKLDTTDVVVVFFQGDIRRANSYSLILLRVKFI